MWGAAQPKSLPQARLRLDFGLRPAIMAFNDWAVPGLAGASFVRQLSWACMGLRLVQEVRSDAAAARIAEGLEALASWMVVKGLPEDVVERRVQGKRKFAGRKTLTFDDVTRGGAYVTVPFRRSTTRALPGLGFCMREEARFAALDLSPVGIELAEHALNAGSDDGQARRSLVSWIDRPDKPIENVSKAIRDTLDPRKSSNQEKHLVHAQILADARRADLAGLLQSFRLQDLSRLDTQREFLGRIHDRAQAARMRTCFAFEDVRASSLQAAQALSEAVSGSAQTPSALAVRPDAIEAFETLATHCSVLLTGLDGSAPTEAVAFCQAQSRGKPLDLRIVSLVQRVPLLFSMTGNCVDRGLGYTGKALVADDAFAAQENEEPLVRGVPQPLLRLRNLLEDLQ